ncbi:MAG: acyl carrier protein [Lachnospiraceae bacterium]|nr:acyl carrier protein [Lachnospiraceae bacterium]
MREKILEILKSVRPDVDFKKENALIDDGVLESFDVIQIATTFMDEFDIYIDADDIEPENLNSLDQICAFVESRKNG